MEKVNIEKFNRQQLLLLALGAKTLLLFLLGQLLNVVEAKIELQWYMHDTPFNGPTPSSIPVTIYNASDFQEQVSSFLFGQIYVFDDPLTETTSLDSQLIGRARGLVSYVSQEEIVSFVSYTVTIQSGSYKGSTLNVQGAAPVNTSIRFYSINGGTGAFVCARGVLAEKIVTLFGPLNASAILSHEASLYM
ncbi:hypothetical protein O6H91_16G044800 [Diphasiastrum complanatum]|uniref:Uncharacterized protein n=2 Tax=Diphasiastrum complanatum TaxID=34168 RepID=A0ACC2BAN7_DIPCM|nr:hypothetical protein O6H91_16G025100 [Diphasiastrum complanatum]KAJ7527255.1 hypothetical protein O6H91_16G044800 [Diphasiastrum complanatum]